MLTLKEITAKVTKTEPDVNGNFNVTISGYAEGEPYDWTLPDTYTEEEWAAVQAQKLYEFRKLVQTQFE